VHTSDFDFEFQLALMNRHLNNHVEAIFLMTSIEHAHLSSTLVKEVARLGGSVKGLVPGTVEERLDDADPEPADAVPVPSTWYRTIPTRPAPRCRWRPATSSSTWPPGTTS